MKNWIKKTKLAIPALLLIAVNLFLYTPHRIYFDNADQFSLPFIEVIPTLMLFVVITITCSWVVLLLLPSAIFKYVTVILTASSLLLWLQSDIFVISYGVLDDSAINFNDFSSRGILELFAILLALTIAIVFSKAVLKHLTFVTLVIALCQFSIVFYQAFNEQKPKPIAQEVDDEFFNYSDSKNIVVIILDTFGAAYFQQVLENNPEFTQLYRGFINYTDAISNYPATKASIPSFLTGTMIGEGSSYSDFLKTSGTSGFLNSYAKQDYLVSAVGAADRFSAIFPQRYITSPTISSQFLLDEQALLLIDFSLFRAAPHHLKPHVFQQGNWWLSTHLTSPEIPTKNPAKAAYMFDMVTQNATVSDSRPRLKFIHIRLPHPVFALDSACNLMPSNSFSEQAVVEQSTCALKKLNNYLMKLKALGVYDNSLIVVTSDHGVRLFNDYSFTGFPSYYELNISGILLMLKGVNQTADFRQVDNPVSLLDIHNLIVDESKHEQSIDFIQSTKRPFYSYQNGFNVRKDLMQAGGIYNVAADYKNPNSWQLKDFHTHKCISKNLPLLIKFKSRNHEQYCAKFGFLAPAADGTGVWSEGSDSRIFVWLDLSPSSNDDWVNFEIKFKPNYMPKQSPYQVQWLINNTVVANNIIKNNAQQNTQFRIPLNDLSSQSEIQIQILLPHLRDQQNAMKDQRNKGLFLEHIKIW